MYSTAKELSEQEKITGVYEDNENYYVLTEPTSEYDDAAWKIDKRTGKVEYFSVMDFLGEIYGNAKQISVNEFRRAFH